MTPQMLKIESDQKLANAERPLNNSEMNLEELFHLFIQVENQLGEFKFNKETAHADEIETDRLCDVQSGLMESASRIRAINFRELLLKVAFWRWDSADINVEPENMSQADAIIYSVFRDLVLITKEYDTLKDVDQTLPVFQH